MYFIMHKVNKILAYEAAKQHFGDFCACEKLLTIDWYNLVTDTQHDLRKVQHVMIFKLFF